MADLDAIKFKKLLESRRVEEAEALLDHFFDQPLSADERSAAQFALASTYMELQSEINETYVSLVADALSKLKEIEALSAAAKDRFDLARVNVEIDALSKKA